MEFHQHGSFERFYAARRLPPARPVQPPEYVLQPMGHVGVRRNNIGRRPIYRFKLFENHSLQLHHGVSHLDPGMRPGVAGSDYCNGTL